MRFATRLRRQLAARGRPPSERSAGGPISIKERSLRVAALAAVLAPIGVVMTTADDTPVHPPEPAVEAPTVVWAGRVFLDRGAVEAFLSARGADYETWAERHPAAAADLEQASGASAPDAR